MSKHRSAPSSERSRCSVARARRSRRSRSKSVRCSQSTAIVPYERMATVNPSRRGARAVCATVSAVGTVTSSSAGENGTGTSSAPIRFTGASSDIERTVGDHGGDLRRHPVALVPLVDDDRAPRLLGGAHDRVLVEREIVRGSITSAEMPSLLEQLRGRERDPHHRARRHDRHVLADALDVGDAERDQVLAVGHLALDRVVHLVLDEDDGVVVTDRRLQQSLRVGRRRGQDDLQARHVRDPRLQRLAVLRGRAPGRAERRPQRQRHLQLPAGHVVRLRRLVRELVHDERQEVAEHDVDDRAQPGHRGTDAEAGDAGLGDRRVEHALRAELLDEAREHLERMCPPRRRPRR